MILKCKPKDDIFCNKVWLKPIKHKSGSFLLENMGLELEMFAFDAETYAPLGTKNASLFPQDLLEKIAKTTKGATLLKDSATQTITGVKFEQGGNFSLEPGGQIEYSSKPTNNLEEVARNVHWGLSLLEEASEKRAIFLSHGTNPVAGPDHPLVVPKERYQFMTRYFKAAPSNIRGIHMMRYTATVQPNLDIFGCADWHTGVQLTLQLVPITNQMFENSSFFQNKKSLFRSERQNVWDNMDPTRSGYPTNLHSCQGCPQTECTYAQWAKRAYMLFIDGLEADKQPVYGDITFEEWLKHGYQGTYPDLENWKTHLGSLFPHLRLRHFLEIRNVDAQPYEHTFAPIAFYSALLKNKTTQQKTWDILKNYQFDSTVVFEDSLNFEGVFNPLIDLACEILRQSNDKIGVQSLQAFKSFLEVRKSYHDEPDGLTFLKKNATFFPSHDFIKNIIV